MKKLKQIVTSALILSTLSVTACSNQSINTTDAKVQSPVVAKYTENTEISQSEIDEINKMMASANIEENNFSVKTAQQGKDISVDLLLMNPKAASRARFWGIKTADKLLNAGSSPTKRWWLNKKLGGLFASDAFKSQVLFWVERADMLRLKDVTLEDSLLLVMAGITSVPDLARYNNIVDQTALRISLSLLAFQYGYPVPSSSEVKSWTNEATMTSPILY